jgi:hypothetical protein
MSNTNQAEILLSQIITDNVKITLPIKKMFGIRTYVILYIVNKKMAYITIEASNCMSIDGDGNIDFERLFFKQLIDKKNVELKLNDIIELIKILNETLKNLKFDKLTGKIVELDNKNLDIDFWNFIIPKCDYIESVFEECCVCYEKTETELKCCEKKLCIQCWDKLKMRYCNECNENNSRNCENISCGYRACPCCRKAIENKEVFDEELFD